MDRIRREIRKTLVAAADPPSLSAPNSEFRIQDSELHRRVCYEQAHCQRPNTVVRRRPLNPTPARLLRPHRPPPPPRRPPTICRRPSPPPPPPPPPHVRRG